MPAFSLAVAVTWDSTYGYRAWREQHACALVYELYSFSRVIGFNLLRFDYRVLSAYYPAVQALLARSTIDILLEIQRRLGHRVSLNNIALATLGRGKSSKGADAPYLYRVKQWDVLTEYCRYDVALTRDIYKFGEKYSHIYCLDSSRPNGRRRISAAWALPYGEMGV